MTERLYLYPAWVRTWHAINAVLCLFLIITGLSLHFTNPDLEIISFETSVLIHDITGILLSLSYLVFIFLNFVTGNFKYYKITWDGLKRRVAKQSRFYAFGLFKGEQPPYPVTEENKFNPLQKLSYVLIMYVFLPLTVITGLGLFFPDIVIRRVFDASGLYLTNILHTAGGFVISLFLIIHVYFSTLGSKLTSNFKSILTGWHVHEN